MKKKLLHLKTDIQDVIVNQTIIDAQGFLKHLPSDIF